MTETLWTGSNDPAAVAAKKREIKARYKAQARDHRGTGVNHIMRIRVIEIDRVYVDRYGDMLPDNAIGRDLAFVLAQTVAGTIRRTTYHPARSVDVSRRRDTSRRHDVQDHTAAAIMMRVRQWCPWMSPDTATKLADAVIARPIHWTADELGRRLGLEDAKRTELGVTTIGACDMTKAERLARRRKRNRIASAERRKAGATARGDSAARTQPWARLGMSRATWYRHGKPQVAHDLRRLRGHQVQRKTAVHAFVSRVSPPQPAGGWFDRLVQRCAPPFSFQVGRVRAISGNYEAGP